MVTLLVLGVGLVLLIISAMFVAGVGDVIVGRGPYGHWQSFSTSSLPWLVLPITPSLSISPLPIGRNGSLPKRSLGTVPPNPSQLPLVPGAMANEDATVLIRRAMDEPPRVLPGRLEVLTGENAGDEIRFIGNFGDFPEILLGREAGIAPHSVTLHSPTISRRHARLEFADGFWMLTNLSHTNPVVLNNTFLPVEGEAQTLQDGDCLELGEVILRFHIQ